MRTVSKPQVQVISIKLVHLWRSRHLNKIKNKTINEQMFMDQEWIGFDAMDKLNNGTTCKASNKLVFNLFEYWLVMTLLLLLIPVLF